MATPNSADESQRPNPCQTGGARTRLSLSRRTGLSLLLVVLGARAEDLAPVASEMPQTRAHRRFAETKRLHEGSPTNSSFGWHFARACFDWAEYATNDQQRATIAEQGIEVSRAILAREPKLVPAQYYLAMNLGQLARTRTLGALGLVTEMESLFLAVRDADEQFDEAGADRCLGLLYRDAPGWPISVGSRSKARRHLRRAVDLAPDFPENRLNLVEGLLRWNDFSTAREEVERLAQSLPPARQRLSDVAWQASWIDWNQRWNVITNHVDLFPPGGPATPR